MPGLEVIDNRYRTLWIRAQQVFEADDRVLSVSLGGSVGSGTADAWSDLDLQVVVAPEHHEAFLAEWPSWLAQITPTVFARTPIAPFVINTVTDEGLTLDIVVYSGSVFTFTPPTDYTVGMLSGQRFGEVSAALEYAVAEQLRGMAGPFVSMVKREEHLRHLTGVPHLLGLLTVVFLAELNAPPPGKLWNETFTAEQLAAVAAIPPASATYDGVVGFGLGVAELLLTRARPLFRQFDLEWPADLARVAATRVHNVLGIDTTSWCY